jgi:hypothetical protein
VALGWQAGEQVFSGPARELCSEWLESAVLGLGGGVSSREPVALCWEADEQAFSGLQRRLQRGGLSQQRRGGSPGPGGLS